MPRLVSLASLIVLISACGGSSTPPATPEAPSLASTQPAHEARAPELKAPGEATIGDRTTCLTSGEEFTVSAASPKVEYGGKTYYFCCAGCDKKFAADPEKYLNKKPDA